MYVHLLWLYLLLSCNVGVLTMLSGIYGFSAMVGDQSLFSEVLLCSPYTPHVAICLSGHELN
jgi:hypothetical protein